MKHIGLIGLSVAAAALIMAGCGSSGSSGPKAPADIKNAVDVNVDTVKNAIAFLMSEAIVDSASAPKSKMIAKIAKESAAVKAKMAALKATYNDSESESGTEECGISGTYDWTWKGVYTWNDEGGWTDEYTYTEKYNNCVDNYSDTINGIEVDREVWKGNRTWTDAYAYNSGSDMSHESHGWTYDSTRSLTDADGTAAFVETDDYNYGYSWDADGDWWESTEEPSEIYSWHAKGNYKEVDYNASGDMLGGDKGISDIKESYENTYAEDRYVFMSNGFDTEYDINSSGAETLSWGVYFNDFMVEATIDGNEETMTVKGTAGSTCLGGSMNFSTDPIVQQNQTDYFDSDDQHGGNVLPYAGMVSLKGANGSGTVAFDSNESNYTSAFVDTPDGNATYTRWVDLASGTCAVF